MDSECILVFGIESIKLELLENEFFFFKQKAAYEI